MKKKVNINMIKTVKQYIFRSPYQSLAAILAVSLSLFLITFFFLAGTGSQKVLTYFETRPQVSAFLKDEVKPQEIEVLKEKIKQTGKVRKINYISKESALEIYREQNKDKPLLLEMVTAKILPASLEVSTTDLSALKEIAEILENEALVEDVVFQEDVVGALAFWVGAIRKAGMAVAVFLLFVSVLTVLTIMGMKISQRKEEIEILKLLGASSAYLSLPFYLEGMVYGLLAALISWGLSYLGILYTTPFLIQFFAEVALVPVPFFFMLKVLGGLAGLGLVVGFLGSLLAVSRFSHAVK